MAKRFIGSTMEDAVGSIFDAMDGGTRDIALKALERACEKGTILQFPGDGFYVYEDIDLSDLVVDLPEYIEYMGYNE